MSAQVEQAVRRAGVVLLERERLDESLRLTALDERAAAYRDAIAGDARGMRAYVIALQIIDLGHQERHQAAELMRAQLRTDAARKAGQARAAAALEVDVPACRSWAVAHGYDVPSRGRYLPGDVVAAWREAGSPGTVQAAS
jgi:hypothetical protein